MGYQKLTGPNIEVVNGNYGVRVSCVTKMILVKIVVLKYNRLFPECEFLTCLSGTWNVYIGSLFYVSLEKIHVLI